METLCFKCFSVDQKKGLIILSQSFPEGYTGGSNAVEIVSTSSAGAADTSSQLPSASNPASSINQHPPASLSLPSISIKQEMYRPPSAGQPSLLAQTISCNADGPRVALFPSDLLLLSPPHLAASTTAATSSIQLRPGCSTSVNTPPAAESSDKQQEPVPREGLNVSVKSESLAREEIVLVESHSEEEMANNLSNVKGKELTAVKSTFVPEKDKNASTAASDDDGGNESDNSVEMMEPSNLVVIDIDESDKEDSPETVSNVTANQEPPQQSVSVEFSSATTQTQQNVER